MAASLPVPPTRVLAVASHVVSGYVGNKVAVFVLQSLGCDVAALNTVQFSNHTGYRRWTGTTVSAREMSDLYEGLRRCLLDNFDMMLSGYVPGAQAVAAVGEMAKALKEKANRRSPASTFFWVLDPVMGDNGKLYVAEDVVPAYRSLIPYADLILPNKFEAELLSGVKIVNLDSLQTAVQALHDQYKVPHVVITSVRLPGPDQPPDQLSVLGSTMKSDGRARLFRVTVPSIDCYFCGAGDMFGALVTVRMRQAVDRHPGLAQRPSWQSEDAVPATELPLARAVELVLASMQQVLSKTREAMPAALQAARASLTAGQKDEEETEHLVATGAAELQLVRNLDCLRDPKVHFRAEAV